MSDPTVHDRLFAEPFTFDFFQAVRLLERLDPKRRPVGIDTLPAARESVRFRAHESLSFPPSTIWDLRPAAEVTPLGELPPVMVVAFLGLTGPSGVLPRHYTELLQRTAREAKHPEKFALRDWFDQFNHRFISLFYRAWEKYRFYIPYERGEYARPDPDPFTRCLFSLIGLGAVPLRERLRVSIEEEVDDERRRWDLAKIDDLALLHYSGFLAHRPRNAVSLEAMLIDYFQRGVQLVQFRGQWLVLEPESMTRLGEANSDLGGSVVCGDRVFDAQSKFRLRVGPLSYDEFTEFLPDRSPVPQRKAFFLLCHLVRLYAGPDLDFDVQLILKAAEVPDCRLREDSGGGMPRLGWNTWVKSLPPPRDAEEAVFEGEEVVWVGERLSS